LGDIGAGGSLQAGVRVADLEERPRAAPHLKQTRWLPDYDVDMGKELSRDEFRGSASYF
jgi:hypothetical protein